MKAVQIIQEGVPFAKAVCFTLAVDLLLILAIFIFKNRLPPEVPLFYGLPWGQEQLGNIFLLALPCTISLGMVFLNILIGLRIKDNFLIKTLVFSGLILVYFSEVTTLKIMFLVGNF